MSAYFSCRRTSSGRLQDTRRRCKIDHRLPSRLGVRSKPRAVMLILTIIMFGVASATFGMTVASWKRKQSSAYNPPLDRWGEITTFLPLINVCPQVFFVFTSRFGQRALINATPVHTERCDSHLEGLPHIGAKDEKVRYFVGLYNTMFVRFFVFNQSARSVFLPSSGGTHFYDSRCELANM